MVIYDKDLSKCWEIIDRMEDIGCTNILSEYIRMLCANNKSNIDLIIGQYGEILDMVD